MLNRRSFVQSLGAGAVRLVAREHSTASLAAAVPRAVAPARQGRPDTAGLIRIGGNENPYGPLAQPKTIALMLTYRSNSGMSVMAMAAATASLSPTASSDHLDSLPCELT